MHAKVLVVDGRTALVGSANVTGSAMERNLECGLLVRGGECGLLVRGGAVPRARAEHPSGSAGSTR